MKRLFGLLSAAAGAGLAIGLYARFVEPRWLEVREGDITVDDWPGDLDGVRLGVIGDIHLGYRWSEAWTSPALDRAVGVINRGGIDALLHVGDFGFMRWRPEELAEQAARFTAPVRVAVLGNHDWARGRKQADSLSAALVDREIPVLLNSAIQIEIRGYPVVVAGLGDCHARQTDVPTLLANLPEDRTCPVILLSHSPDAVEDVPSGSFDIAFSGHTHGGQIAIPLLTNYIVRRFAHTGYNRGCFLVNGRPLFVTKGIGMVGQRARFLARPEVAIITVRSGTRMMQANRT